MLQPELKFIEIPAPDGREGPLRRLAWWDWQAPECQDPGHVVVAVHGLSRQGRDFDTLARALAPHCRVVALDVAGRGHSHWLDDPLAYQVSTYVADALNWLAQLRHQAGGMVHAIDWVGTSMGGLIGLGVAAQPAAGLRRLVLNDVGPAIRWAAIERIGTYLGQDPDFESPQAAFDYLRSISAGFGPHTPEQWQRLNEAMIRPRNGRWCLHYDPAIAQPVRGLLALPEPAARQAIAESEKALWALYDSLRLPTLLLRGAESDLLEPKVAQAMTARGPHATLVEFPGVGHAPTLMADDQVRVVREFLLSPA